MPFHRLRGTVSLVSFIGVVGVCMILAVPGVCQAQQKKAPPLPARFEALYRSKMQEVSFDQIAAQLRKAAHINIVTDGEPLLKTASFEFKGTLHQALDQVAEKFDFRWTLSKGGVVLMTKRFLGSAEDRPQVSLPEARQIAADMVKALRTIAYDPAPGVWQQQVNALGQTLTQTQIQTLRSGAKLPASQLSAGQLNTLTQAIIGNTYSDSLQRWQFLTDQLQQLPESYLLTKIRGGDPLNPAVPRYYDVMYVLRANSGSLQSSTFATMPVTVQESQKP